MIPSLSACTKAAKVLKNAHRLADASDDALRHQREHRRQVEADAHLDVAPQALPPLRPRVQRPADGQGEVRRHRVAVQPVQLVVRLLPRHSSVSELSEFWTFSDRKCRKRKIKWAANCYHFHEQEAGCLDGDVRRVLLAAGFAYEPHHDHRRRRQEQELDRQKLHAPFFLQKKKELSFSLAEIEKADHPCRNEAMIAGEKLLLTTRQKKESKASTFCMLCSLHKVKLRKGNWGRNGDVQLNSHHWAWFSCAYQGTRLQQSWACSEGTHRWMPASGNSQGRVRSSQRVLTDHLPNLTCYMHQARNLPLESRSWGCQCWICRRRWTCLSDWSSPSTSTCCHRKESWEYMSWASSTTVKHPEEDHFLILILIFLPLIWMVSPWCRCTACSCYYLQHTTCTVTLLSCIQV